MSNMKINVANLKKMVTDSEPFALNVPTKDIFSQYFSQDEYSFWENGQALIEGVSTAKGQILEISGTVTAVITCPCGRCLEETKIVMTIPFCWEYRESLSPESQAQAESDEDLNYYSGNEIDLRQMVEEVLLLAQPLSQVCREDCLGLCPDCGTNLNITDCGCAAGKIDARLAVLKKLL